MTTYSGARTLKTATLGAMLLSVAMANAATYDIRKNDVIPVRFDSRLSTKDNREGDRFTATAERSGPFPGGTKFEGHIVHLRQKSDRHPASMDLAFDDVLMPDGTRTTIDGVPIPLSDKYVSRDRDGHYVAKSSGNGNAAVGIGAVGGLIIGALLHKPFEGAFIGILAGIAVSATTSNGDQVLVINQDSEAGVLFKRGVRIEAAAASAPPLEPPVQSIGSLSVQIGGKSLSYSQDLAPYRVGSVTMVPIAETAKQLGMTYDEADSSLFVENDSHSLRFEQNSSDYRFDGQMNHLGAATERHNGVWYAPADAFNTVAGR